LRNFKIIHLAVTVVILSLPACSLHNILTSPSPSVETDGLFTTGEAASVASTPWYDDFRDAYLSALIEQSFSQNFDIKAAMSRLDAAQAVYDQSKAGLFPTLNATGSLQDGMRNNSGTETVTTGGVQLNWEVDIFGRLRALAQSDKLQVEATRDDIEAVRLALSAEMSESYYGAIAQNKQLDLLRQQEKLDKQFLAILDARLREGIGTKIDTLQQQGQLADTQSLIPLTQGAKRVYENRMDVLLGVTPDAGNRVGDTEVFPRFTDIKAIGVPSELLLNRPDLRSLQKRLVAQDAEIGAAIADRLPRISLTGSYAHVEGGTADGWIGSVLGSIMQPLIDWGRRKSEVTRNKALYDVQLAEFTQAYLKAVEDVENALYLEDRQREYLKRLSKRRDILNETVSQTNSVFRQGLTDYLPVLEALKALRAIERQLINETFRLIQYRIQLYRAVGGAIPSTSSES